jgi:hypothetical protein
MVINATFNYMSLFDVHGKLNSIDKTTSYKKNIAYFYEIQERRVFF